MRPGDPGFAPAKVNLVLHVTGRRADGYHLLDSFVVFPDVGDRVAADPAPGLSLTLDGPFGISLGAGRDNLVLKAAELLRAGRQDGAALHLTKTLPVASGIGGGSADAAAALRVLAKLWSCPLPGSEGLAALGADVPVCVAGAPARMAGIGDRLSPLPPFPGFAMILVNPGIGVPTPAVFGALASRENAPLAELPPRFASGAELAAWLAAQRNDLEPPARALCPPIDRVLQEISATTGCMLARMSGSGATCFGLYPDWPAATAAADRLRLVAPDWWTAAARVPAWDGPFRQGGAG